MKEAYNTTGKLVEVPINTPTRNKGGVRYLLTSDELSALSDKETAYQAQSTMRDATLEISRLESQITSRRLREAVLGTDGGWLKKQDALISIERAKL